MRINKAMAITLRIMSSVLLAGEWKTALNTGSVETHGELTGGKMVSLGLSEGPTTLRLRVTAHGVSLSILGRTKSSMTS